MKALHLRRRPEASTEPSEYVLCVRDLRKYFPIKEGVIQRVTGHVRAVDGISFDLRRGETVGLVGESGCGKTTLGRCIAGLIDPTEGGAYFDIPTHEKERLDDLLVVSPSARSAAEKAELERLNRSYRIDRLDEAHARHYRPNCQLVSQDPFASLNPRQLVRNIVGRPLHIHHGLSGTALTNRVVELLERVGLGSSHLYRYPHQFSGGQRQRISIARSLALEPQLVILDEPTSALDVSVQAQILNLLHRLQVEHDLTYLFISHDLNVVRHMSDRMVVMYLGQVSEVGSSEALFTAPHHPYTEALIAANPATHGQGEAIRLAGTVPSPAAPPSGCRFHTRCPRVTEVCGWDVDDAVRIVKLHGDFESTLQVSKSSPFEAALTFSSAEQASAAIEILNSPVIPAPMAAAMTVTDAVGKVVQVTFDAVDDVALMRSADGRETSCILYSGGPVELGTPTTIPEGPPGSVQLP